MRKDWYILIWKDGKFFDLWHLNHLMAGMLLGQESFFFGNPYLVFVISLILIIGWEVYEMIIGVTETKFNRTMDIILALIGFFITYKLSDYMNVWLYLNLFFILLISWLILEIWGYIAYKNKKMPPRVV